MSAALTENRKNLTFAVLNPSDSEQKLKLSITGGKLSTHGRLWRMAPASLDATITVGEKLGVEVQEEELTTVPESAAVPPFSVNIYSFPLQ